MKRVLAAALLCVAVYLLMGPPHDGDFAAQTARADLFGRAGFVPWFAGWYAGLHMGGYSLTTPELMWWLRPAGLGAVCIVASGGLGLVLLRSGHARRPVLGASALAVAQLVNLLSGRVTFGAGAVAVLAGMVAAERRHWGWAAAFGALASVTSPVDGLLAGVVAGVYLLSDPQRHREGWAVGLGAGAGLAFMVLAFPDPGYEPFGLSSLVPALATCVAVALFPVGRRVRCGCLLSALLVFGAFVVHTPVGTNASRLPMLLAIPALIAAMRLPGLLLVPLVALLMPWPMFQLASDLSAAGEPSATGSYYAPLISEFQLLHRQEPALDTQRVEVVEPKTHWQVVYLVPTVTLARGWVRQLDESLNPLFYDGHLTAATYRQFLTRNAVGLVALPRGTPIDFSSTGEATLLESGLPYLRVIWSSPHWTLYQVVDPTPVAAGDGVSVSALTATGMDLSVPAAGTVRLRLRYSSYLTVAGGRVSRGADGDVMLRLPQGGSYDLHAVWSLAGIWHAIT